MEANIQNIPLDQLVVLGEDVTKPVRTEVLEVIRIVLERHGLAYPLTVCPRPDGKYDVILGRLVLSAWTVLKLASEIPCSIVEPRLISCAEIAVFDDQRTERLSSIEPLRRSIRHHGLMVPIAVRPIGSRFALIDGFRRLTVWRCLHPFAPIEAVIIGIEQERR